MKSEGTAAADYLLEILGGKCKVQAVSTAAALGLADRLASGPRDAESLARELGCDPRALAGLLRLLTGLGFFACPTPGVFALTDRGAALRTEALGPLAAFVGAPEQWDPWSRLRDTIRSGGVAFERVHGQGLYDYLASTPEAARRYDAAIDAFTRHQAAALCRAFDFAMVQRVVDLGGGGGTLLLEVMRRWPHLRGSLFDLPHVVEWAGPRLKAQLGERVDVEGGDFFARIPGGADVYVLKHILHNWSDALTVALLQRCAQAMGENGRVLIIEAVLAPDNRADLACLMDLEMLVMTGGRERRKPELRRMLRSADLVLERMAPLTPASWLLVGARQSGD